MLDEEGNIIKLMKPMYAIPNGDLEFLEGFMQASSKPVEIKRAPPGASSDSVLPENQSRTN
jgi:hypothetical protein